ncbi:hypothetical protein RHP47_00715 [Thermosynechococcus sp. QKsg1]|uniref:capsular polysaccharide export protein, LipB/KpsS family n=1 Tax=Thermosynechococcus sp. QKsg1 TaxID=3074130 RepID=UPI0028779714|nr:hypothetical protein [Thermosynechococcus sp. QKsg1]WNC86864.1 hypothetical protein RHP47_00715 [Thermosynechococcus sp. QKsg1]
MATPYRAIVLQQPYFAKMLSTAIDLEFCLCIYQFSSFKYHRKNKEFSNVNFTIEIMDHDDLRDCIYNQKLLASIPPVDRYILNSMEMYTSEIVSIIHRATHLPYTQARDQYYQHLKFWLWYLRDRKINLFFGAVPHMVYDSFIYYLCKLMSIKTILIHPLGISGSYTLMSDWRIPDPRVDTLCQKYINDPDSVDISHWSPQFAEFISNQKLQVHPPYIKQTFDQLGKNKILAYLMAINTKSINPNSIRSKMLKYLMTISIKLIRILRKIAKILKIARALKLLHKPVHRFGNLYFDLYYESLCTITNNSCLDNEPYIYVPLHYQPECSTLPMGEFFENQKIMIEWLSHSRPEDVWLYVREHPAQTYDLNTSRYREPSFYSDILRIPRVRLVSRRCSSFDLIKNSLCVATITGTVTLESLYQEKPVLFFGYHVYQYAPGVFPIRDLSDCSNALKKICNQEFDLTREKFLLYLKALEKNCIMNISENNWHELDNWYELGRANDETEKKFLDSFLEFLNFLDCS